MSRKSLSIAGDLLSGPGRRAIVGTLKWRYDYARAWLWRRTLNGTTTVAVTGSCGKTTTKELVTRCLETEGSVTSTPGNWNGLRFGGIGGTVLSAGRGDRFLVVETGVEKPGDMRRIASLVRPDVVVVTRVAPAHLNHFGSLDAIAQEKGTLVEKCRPGGLIVLNRDDERVYSMAGRASARVITFGAHPAADVRCLSAEGRWPARLSLEIQAGERRQRVRSRLVGTHWRDSILASLATAWGLGVPLPVAAERIEALDPVWARMQPIELPSGATFIRDDFHASPHNFETAFELFRTAAARRKVLVSSAPTDSPEHSRARMRWLARKAHEIFDVVVLYGEHARVGIKLLRDRGLPPELLLGTDDVLPIVPFLRRTLREGDLVLLKGRTTAHISRAYLGLIGDVACGLSSCRRQILCDRCPKLGFTWTEELRGLMAPPDAML